MQVVNTMVVEAIDRIAKMIRNGSAYTVDTECGTFVCVESAKVLMHVKNPVHYPILKDLRFGQDDFPVWAPYIDGNPSPWGRGQPTVNLGLIL